MREKTDVAYTSSSEPQISGPWGCKPSSHQGHTCFSYLRLESSPDDRRSEVRKGALFRGWTRPRHCVRKRKPMKNIIRFVVTLGLGAATLPAQDISQYTSFNLLDKS